MFGDWPPVTLQAERRQKQSMHIRKAQLAVSAASAAASGAVAKAAKAARRAAYSSIQAGKAANAATQAATATTDNWGDAQALRIPRSMALCSS